MTPDMQVRIVRDEWFLFGRIGKVIDAEPVPGSSQMLVDVDGVKVTLSRYDVQAITSK